MHTTKVSKPCQIISPNRVTVAGIENETDEQIAEFAAVECSKPFPASLSRYFHWTVQRSEFPGVAYVVLYKD